MKLSLDDTRVVLIRVTQRELLEEKSRTDRAPETRVNLYGGHYYLLRTIGELREAMKGTER